MNYRLREVCGRAIGIFGAEDQTLLAMEECAELIQALSHKLRGRNHNVEEEIADVEIMLCQMKLLADEEKIKWYRAEKLSRLDGLIRQRAERIRA